MADKSRHLVRVLMPLPKKRPPMAVFSLARLYKGLEPKDFFVKKMLQ